VFVVGVEENVGYESGHVCTLYSFPMVTVIKFWLGSVNIPKSDFFYF
jgi:hypothetical protein